ncbi:MAG: LacI family DNA-binding transcriptional regulator [Pseudomonadota bacterium]
MTNKKKPATVKDVAKRANVSISTVSNVINERSNFSDSTRKKVLKAISELAYVPDRSASSLRSAKQWSICFVLRDTSYGLVRDPVLAEIVAGISNRCQETGYDLTVKLWGHDEFDAFQVFRRQSFDGVVLLTSGIDAEYRKTLAEVQSLNVPIVVVKNQLLPDAHDIAVVNQDDEEGGRLIAEHLLARGAHSFAFLSVTTPWFSFERRYQAIADTLADLSPGSSLEKLSARTEGFSDAQDAMSEYFRKGNRVDAIIGATDALAIGAMRAAQAAGLRVPKDIAFGGFNAQEAAKFVTPSLTSIDMPLYDVGQRAGDIIISRLETGAFESAEHTIAARLIRGGST